MTIRVDQLPAATSVAMADLLLVEQGGIAKKTTVSLLPVTRRAFGILIDGGGSAINTGIKGDIPVPYTGTIRSWTLIPDQVGSIVIDIWKVPYASAPPTVANSITASAKPTLSSATKNQSSTLTGWTVTVNAGDIFRFNVDSITSITRVTLEVEMDLT